MFEVRQTDRFRIWLSALRDLRGKTAIIRRIDRAEAGNMGDTASVGAGVSEMRVHGKGPGYRIYFTMRGVSLIVLLVGGDKGTQARDIAAAQKLARELEE